MASGAAGGKPFAPARQRLAAAGMSFVASLRAATAAEHDAVDAAYARYDLADRASYAAFLMAHARALAAAEAALAVHGLAGRVRMPALAADLAALDAAVPPALPFAVDAPGAWGAHYVVEGSRLGGAMLAKQVGAGLPRAYLAAVHGPGEWRAIRAEIDAAATEQDAAWRAAALAGAHATFALYRDAADCS